MKKTITISFLMTSIFSFGQYSGPEVNDSILNSNNIFKCIEYDAEDSTLFFSNYRNAYYWIYNKEGQVVERNAYGYGSVQFEFTVHYLYDNEGRNIFWMWLDNSVTGKVSRVRFEEYDSLGNNFAYRDFSGTEKYSKAYRTKNYNKTDYPEPKEYIDRVISKSKKEYYYLNNENKTDTLEHKIEYYSDGMIDSTITYFNRKNYPYLQVESFTYYASKTIESSEIKSFDEKGKINIQYKTVFLENELPKERWYIYYFKGVKSETHTKLLYYKY